MHAPLISPAPCALEPAVNASTESGPAPVVGIIMGSDSDWKTMEPVARLLNQHGVAFETKVVSAHRTPDLLFDYAKSAEKRGLSLIIAGAGGAAHLPGMAASMTIVPVVGVPVIATPLDGFDAFLSIMQMPPEVGVATVGVGREGASNAAHFAVLALAASKPYGAAGAPGASGKVAILFRDAAEQAVLLHAEQYLTEIGVLYETVILEQGLSQEGMEQKLAGLEASGTAVVIAGSLGGIGFAREVAQATSLPVLGVPIINGSVGCLDEFLRPFLDMPCGLATFAIGKPGAINAALFAAAIISGRGSDVWKTLQKLRDEQVKKVQAMTVGI